MDRRSRHIRILPDGRRWDEDVMRDYLASLDARAPKRVTVERLSRKERGT